MKNFINQMTVRILLCLSLVIITFSCYDSDEVGENFYTFTGETVGSYLEKHPETYSEFTVAVEKAGMKDLLKTYNKYTCFAPTNEAMLDYYSSLGISSVENLSDSIVKYLVYSHILSDRVYQPSDFTEGALTTTNMNSRYLVIGFKANVEKNRTDILINTNSVIVAQDSVENGMIYALDRVLTPSNVALPDLMYHDQRISLFTEALKATGLDAEMQLIKDYEYVPELNPISIYGKVTCRSPKERKFGYTAFVETDEVFARTHTKSGKPVVDMETLKEFAAEIYNAAYPEDAGISDVTDRRNSLNRFIAYHLIDKTVNYNNFFYKANMVLDIPLYEFMETMSPNTMFKVSNEGGNVIINSDIARGITGVKVLPIVSGYEQDTQNGVYHLIDKVLLYDQTVITMLLNTRIRMDAASLHPELMTNGIRYEKGDNPSGVSGDDKYYKFPNGYMKNVEIVSNNTRLYYLQGNATWCNYQADEMMALGQFDFIMRLPPVPAGTYEIRFGYTANPLRGILQFYVDGEPQGIPLNMKRLGTDAAIGWMVDGSDGGFEVDKMMRNRGYMKGGTSYKNTTNTGRTHNGALRRIVCTKTWDYDGPHYLRFKSVSTDETNQFMIDYFEYVPKNIYANPSGEPEDRL